MINNWPYCKCDICLIMQSHKEQGINLDYKEEPSVLIAPIISVGASEESSEGVTYTSYAFDTEGSPDYSYYPSFY
jgi:hypothetical protein